MNKIKKRNEYSQGLVMLLLGFVLGALLAFPALGTWLEEDLGLSGGSLLSPLVDHGEDLAPLQALGDLYQGFREGFLTEVNRRTPWEWDPLVPPVREVLVQSESGLTNETMPSVEVPVNSGTPSEPLPDFGPHRPFRLLVIGDSIAIGPYYSFLRGQENDPSWEVEGLSRISSTLVEPRFLDWPQTVQEMIQAGNHYDAVLVFLGSNDAQPMRIGDQRPLYNTEPWLAEYHRRIRAFLDQLRQLAPRIYWAGVPPMLRADYNQRMIQINAYLAQEMENWEDASFHSLYPVLADPQGGYTPSLLVGGRPVLVRDDDGVHFQPAGSDLVREYLKDIIRTEHSFSPPVLPLDTSLLTAGPSSEENLESTRNSQSN